MRRFFNSATIVHVCAAVLLVLLVSACAGTPRQAQSSASSERQIPSWTYETPAPSGGFTYFVGYADGPAEGQVQAMEHATASLIAEIMRYIGVTISAESTARARSSLDSFEADLVQTVTQSSSNRVAGFQISERFVLEREDSVSVFLLGRYETAELEAEKSRIAALFQERSDAVALPEAEGRRLMAAGNMIGAARSFINAAVAASSSGAENAPIQFERNINNARDALSRLSIEKLNDNLQANPGQPFAEPFRARVLSGSMPQSDVPVLVGYQARLPNGRMTTRSTTLMSDNQGMVSFMHPPADFVGKASLSMRLDFGSSTEALYGVPQRYASLVVSLEDLIASKRAAFDYTLISRAKEIPTAVLIVDQNPDGSLGTGITNSALLQSLGNNGFRVSSAALPLDLIASGNDTNIARAALEALSGNSDRFAYGLTRPVSIRDDRNQKIATVSAEIKVIEISSGRILYSAVKQVPAVGASEAVAVDAARRQLGQQLIGDDMAAQLP